MKSSFKIKNMQSLNAETETQNELPEATVEAVSAMLKELRLSGMKDEFERLCEDPEFLKLGLRQQLYYLLKAELIKRQNSRYKRRMKESGVASKATATTIMERQKAYRLDPSAIEMLMGCGWIQENKALLISGKSGLGKTDLGAAILDSGARKGLKVKAVDYRYAMIDLCDAVERKVSKYNKALGLYTKNDLLFLDDCFVGQRRFNETAVLKDLVEQCKKNQCGLIFASQVHPTNWVTYLGGDELADAVMDRILEKPMSVEVSGDSNRSTKTEHLNREQEDDNNEAK